METKKKKHGKFAMGRIANSLTTNQSLNRSSNVITPIPFIPTMENQNTSKHASSHVIPESCFL